MAMIYSELHLQLETVDNLNSARNLKRFLHHAEDVLFRIWLFNLAAPLLLQQSCTYSSCDQTTRIRRRVVSCIAHL